MSICFSSTEADCWMRIRNNRFRKSRNRRGNGRRSTSYRGNRNQNSGYQGYQGINTNQNNLKTDPIIHQETFYRKPNHLNQQPVKLLTIPGWIVVRMTTLCGIRMHSALTKHSTKFQWKLAMVLLTWLVKDMWNWNRIKKKWQSPERTYLISMKTSLHCRNCW